MAGLTDISLGNFTRVYIDDIGSSPSLTEVLDVQSVGDISDEATIVDVQAYGQKYLKKLVGSANAAAIEVVCNYNPTDPGQIEMLAAYNGTIRKNVRISMDAAEPKDVGHYTEFECLVGSASVTNSFDETRTITFSIVPTNGIGAYIPY